MTTIRATYKLTGWNASQLQARIPAVLRAYRPVLGREFKDQIKAVQFSWPRTTERKNGATVGSPRDIVDMGAFLGSQREESLAGVGRYELRYTWNVPYARLILMGYEAKGGTYCPPRNWIEPALQAQPLDRFFAAEWRAQARRRA